MKSGQMKSGRMMLVDAGTNEVACRQTPDQQLTAFGRLRTSLATGPPILFPTRAELAYITRIMLLIDPGRPAASLPPDAAPFPYRLKDFHGQTLNARSFLALAGGL